MKKNEINENSDDSMSLHKDENHENIFTNVDVCNSDHYLYCDICGRTYNGECLIHGPYLPVKDKTIKLGSSGRAHRTCPEGISIEPSKSKPGELGAWAKKAFELNSVFGPYEGVDVSKDDQDKPCLVFDGGYAWEIYRNGDLSHYIDGSDDNKSNWLRFVNCTRNRKEQNLVAYQYKGHIYYRAYKKIKKEMELLVWCSNQYAEQIGFNSKTETENSENICRTFSEYRKCTKCGDLFADDEALQRHLRRKHPDRSVIKQYKCDFCPYSSDSRNCVKIHIRIHTKEKPFDCPYCSKAFARKQSLNNHVRTHTKERPYKCDKCEKDYSRYNNLKNHILTAHENRKLYICKVCGVGYRNLNAHMSVHTGERKYKCQYCDKTFATHTATKKHERRHTGERPFKCKQCSADFTDKSNLNFHVIRMHTKEYRYKCSKCDKGFLCPSYLNKHESRCLSEKNNLD